RFGARLQLKIEIPRELLCAQVPSLILQLIVENAIKHGIAKLAQGGAIRIAAYRLNGSLQLIVYNDGPSLPSNWEQTNSGIGMANMRTRLRSLYGDAFELSMQNQSPSGVAVTVSVPWMESQSRERDKSGGKIRALIVDDEPLARSNLAVLLRSDPEIEIVGECGSGVEALTAIRTANPDLVFLDVQMPECDGFDVLEMLGNDLPPAVVFVTAYDQYALRAFEAGALDYLLKPFDNARFDRALARAKKRIAGKVAPSIERIAVKSVGQVSFLKMSEIDWIEAADYYSCLHVGPRSHLLRRSMTDLE